MQRGLRDSARSTLQCGHHTRVLLLGIALLTQEVLVRQIKVLLPKLLLLLAYTLKRACARQAHSLLLLPQTGHLTSRLVLLRGVGVVQVASRRAETRQDALLVGREAAVGLTDVGHACARCQLSLHVLAIQVALCAAEVGEPRARSQTVLHVLAVELTLCRTQIGHAARSRELGLDVLAVELALCKTQSREVTLLVQSELPKGLANIG